MTNKKLFISKNDSELLELNQYCAEHSIDLTAKSFLQFKPCVFNIEKSYEVIFFSSPRSVLFFSSRFSIPSSVEIACIGAKTKAVLDSLGKAVQFFGTSSSPLEVGQNFKEWCGQKTVLFPLSDISKKSISSLFEDNKKIEVVAYTTEIIEHKISQQDCYVFTSPSNVTGFFNSENNTNDCICIAWGLSTQLELEKNGIQPITLREPSTNELITVLQNIE